MLVRFLSAEVELPEVQILWARREKRTLERLTGEVSVSSEKPPERRNKIAALAFLRVLFSRFQFDGLGGFLVEGGGGGEKTEFVSSLEELRKSYRTTSTKNDRGCHQPTSAKPFIVENHLFSSHLVWFLDIPESCDRGHRGIQRGRKAVSTDNCEGLSLGNRWWTTAKLF